MARTTVQICGITGERKYYGFTVGGGVALGQTDSVAKGTFADTDWCRVHHQVHPSTEVVVDVPFEGDDFKNPQGDFDTEWGKRFNALASKRVDQILFKANQTGKTVG